MTTKDCGKTSSKDRIGSRPPLLFFTHALFSSRGFGVQYIGSLAHLYSYTIVYMIYVCFRIVFSKKKFNQINFDLIVSCLSSPHIFLSIFARTTFILFSLVYPNMRHVITSILLQISSETVHSSSRILKTK